jgi:capsular exopolysaccharide synthesis family protein
MNTYIAIASSSPVLDELRNRLDLGPDQPESVEVIVIPDSELIQITVEDFDPILAIDSANMLAELLLNERSIRDTQIYLIEPANLPEPTSLWQSLMFTAFALVFGLVLGTGLAYLVENLDTRLHSTKQIEEVSGLPIFGRIPKTWQIKRKQLLLHKPHFNHGIRSLRTILLLRERQDPSRYIMVMSAFPKEGKSTICANLGISLAYAGKKVLIIDADMHYPTIHKIFTLNNEIGLSTLLEDSELVESAIQGTNITGLEVLPGGPETPRSTELLSSSRMSSLLDDLSENFDHVLIDTPAFLGIPDTATIVPFVDCILLVTKRGSIKEQTLRATLEQLEQIGVKPTGLIVNNAEQVQFSRYRKYYRHSKVSDPAITSIVTEEDSESKKMLDTQGKLILLREKLDHVLNPQKILSRVTQPAQNRDDLTIIDGIGPSDEKLLNEIGITSFAKLAAEDHEILAEKIDGRISLEQIQIDQWIQQASELSQTDDETHPSVLLDNH